MDPVHSMAVTSDRGHNPIYVRLEVRAFKPFNVDGDVEVSGEKRMLTPKPLFFNEDVSVWIRLADLFEYRHYSPSHFMYSYTNVDDKFYLERRIDADWQPRVLKKYGVGDTQFSYLPNVQIV